MAHHARRIEVHKFGGTSVADAVRLQSNANTLRAYAKNASLVVVSSATAKTTDALIRIGQLAVSGQGAEAEGQVLSLRIRHLEILKALGDDETVKARLMEVTEQLTQLVRALAITRDLTLRTQDRLLAAGEKLAVPLFALALTRAGLNAEPISADRFLDTDDVFGSASALTGVADRTTRSALQPILNRGVIPVVTGFCGRAPDGATTTLGRGGSDLSASLIAAALGAEEVIIWTDVSGVYTADPNIAPAARVIQQLNYREAAEMSYYGAKVLHQRTMIPVQQQGIPVRTKNSLRPEDPGTLVNSRFTPGSHPVKAVSAIRNQALVSIEGKGMSGVAGMSARVFGALAEQGISATMISQASSESSICLAIRESQADKAAHALREAFRRELSRGEIEEVSIRKDVGLIAIVGLGMAQTPGVAARCMNACAKAKVSILAIAQGSSELNITIASDQADLNRAVRALHEDFDLGRIDTGVETPNGLSLIMVGVGSIGRSLLKLMSARKAAIRERFGLEARVVGMADTSGFVINAKGFDSADLGAMLKRKAEGGRLIDEPSAQAGTALELVQEALKYRLSRPVLVDVSDAETAGEVFEAALARGCDVVTANKKPLSSSAASFQSLMATAERAGRMLKAEATVGAGLPVIDTLEILRGTGDHLYKAEGCLSGTLGYVMSRLEAGESFSEAVASAREAGYSEPDPVADLSGQDVARKATILGRWSGLLRPDDPVELSGLVDESWAGLPWEALQSRLQSMDAEIKAKVDAAKAEGEVLRYVAVVKAGEAKVGLRSVPKSSPTGRLSGTENLILFSSERYDQVPLVITGPGAGIDVTAMGVLGDILRVAAERGNS